jgi:hypothetical protein
MKRLTMSAVLGLSIIGGVLVAPNSANAFRLRNFKNPSLFLGVSRGTPAYGSPFIVWTEDLPVSTNQTFSGTASYVTSHAGTNATIPLLDLVATGAIGDFSSYTPYRQPMFVGYPSNGTYYQKNFWKVDNSVTLTSTNWEPNGSNGQWVTSQCYRFTNEATLKDASHPNRVPQNLGVAGGNPQAGNAVYAYDAFSDWWNHVDQFWCPID